MKNIKLRNCFALTGCLFEILLIMSGCSAQQQIPHIETEPAGSIIIQSDQTVPGNHPDSNRGNLPAPSDNAHTVIYGTKRSDESSDLVGLSLMQPILQGMIISTDINGLKYSSSNPDFIWRCLLETTAADTTNNRYADKSGNFHVPQNLLLNYLNSFFEETVELPDIPYDLSGFISYDDQAKQYIMTRPVSNPVSVTVTHVEQTDNEHSKITLQSATDSGKLSFWYVYITRSADRAYPYVIQYVESDDYICNDILEGGTIPISE